MSTSHARRSSDLLVVHEGPFILYYNGILFFPQILNLFLSDIFEHNILLQTNESTKFLFLINRNIVLPLKDGALSGSADHGKGNLDSIIIACLR